MPGAPLWWCPPLRQTEPLDNEGGEPGDDRVPPPYARLLVDVLEGDPSLSIRGDEAEESWRIVEPILAAWKAGASPLLEYRPGHTGPSPYNQAEDLHRVARLRRRSAPLVLMRLQAGYRNAMKKTFPARILLLALLVVPLAACDQGDDQTGAPENTDTTATEPARPPADQTPAQPGTGLFVRIPEIVRNVEPSVVAVLTNLGEGSGVIWRTEGLVLTNHHVVERAHSIELAFADGKRSPARVVATDPLTDLALLRSDRQELPAATFAEDLPVVGELAVAIGNPLGFENTVTAGIISGLHRSIPGSAARTQALIDLVQTDAAISPGNSGGALVGGDGNVVGINVAYIPPQAQAVSIGFAIPAPTVTEVARQLLDQGTVRHAYFGIQPGPLNPEVARLLDVEAEGGVLVLDVVAGGPAGAAGIRPGDVIVTVAGKQITSLESFLAELRRHDPGDRLVVEVIREDQRLTVTVTLAKRPRT